MSKTSHDVKKLVRERQARTGESYTKALYTVRAEVDARRAEREQAAAKAGDGCGEKAGGDEGSE